jgi:hypothetical protein
LRLETAFISKISALTTLALCGLFFVAGCAFVPLAGIQNDEALFAAAIYPPTSVAYSRTAFHVRIPLMLMSYLGALKSWVYMAVFRVWAPSPASIRVPVLLAGAATIWLLFVLLRHVSGNRAASIGCAFLATDPIFLLTTCFDWGPVVLQHLLLLGAVVMLVKFSRGGSLKTLAAGFFLFGLGLWDKALFMWSLAALGAGALAAFPRESLRSIAGRRAAVAILGLCVGALPLILYNGSKRLETLRSNAVYSTQDLYVKAHLLRLSLQGSALLGWMAADDAQTPQPRAPESRLERASVWLSRSTGRPRGTLMGYAFLLSVVLVPVLWLMRAALAVRLLVFALTFMAVLWVQMAFTYGAGGGVHHTVLLWPAPHFFMGVALAEVSLRLRRLGALALALILIVVPVSNLLVTNQYYAQFVQNGGALNWTDAIYPLSDFMKTVSADYIFVIDWGMLETLRLLHRGSLPLREGSEYLNNVPATEKSRKIIRDRISNPRHIFVGHTEGNEFFTGVSARLQALAAESGYRKELLTVIPDRNGRPIFEVFRFLKTTESRRFQTPGPAPGYRQAA